MVSKMPLPFPPRHRRSGSPQPMQTQPHFAPAGYFSFSHTATTQDQNTIMIPVCLSMRD